MRIAYLILAHTNPRQLARIVGGLSRGSVAFIHIDAKCDISQFLACLPESDSVHFLTCRENICWAGFGMVIATLRLIEEALQYGRFDYYALMSGSDYPISSDERLFEKLKTGNEFITCRRMPNGYAPLNRLSCYFIPFTDRNSRLARLINGILWRLPVRNWRKSIELAPYSGVSWWFLTHACIEHIMSYIKDHIDYPKGFLHARYPDESFFQTIVANSPFRERVVDALTFADWWKQGGPRPAILDDSYMDCFAKSESLFARKFNEHGAMEIFDRIDQELRGR